jgi:hypothetical protein
VLGLEAGLGPAGNSCVEFWELGDRVASGVAFVMLSTFVRWHWWFHGIWGECWVRDFGEHGLV